MADSGISDLARIRSWCASQVSGEVANEVRVVANVDGHHVVIAEERPPWPGQVGDPWESYPLARLTYLPARSSWKLEVSTEGDGFGRFANFPSGSPSKVLAEIDDDPTFVFWG